MNPADEYAALKAEIASLERRVKDLRQQFVDGRSELESNAHVVTVRHQKRRVFLRDALPACFLEDPNLWENRVTPIVTVKARVGVAKETQGKLQNAQWDDQFFDVLED